MNTQNKNDRKKNQRQSAGPGRAVTKKQDHNTYPGSHEQERPETRLTR